MPYITGERKQGLLLPSSIEDYINPSDPVRAYDAFVDQVDITELGIQTEPNRVGAPEFDPRAMLKLLVYGYSYGVRSSRKLERATHHNLSFIWLTGGLQPDHKTIARFRRDNQAALSNILKACAHVCLKLGLVEGNTLFVDGTKVHANASMKNTWTEKRCLESLKDIDSRIARILSECEQADASEQGNPSLVKMRECLGKQGKLKEKIQGVLKDLQAGQKNATNTTDPESVRLRSNGRLGVGYNCQSVVDDKHGLIVHSDVVQASCDSNQFSLQIEKAQQALGKPCATACADAGYASTEDLKKSLDEGMDVIVPSARQVKDPSSRVKKEHFAYDAKDDCYRCPQGHLLRYIGDHKQTKSRIYAVGDPEQCRQCPLFRRCTNSDQGRRVERLFLEDVRERIEQRYLQADAQAVYRRRKLRVEHPFGHLKQNLGIRSFLLRGLAGVKAEAALAATAFNLVRITTILGPEAFVQRLAA
ncbi:MAG TPA: IS1182 family transposase [Elusimicrobia bacterium]|nr:IS1182 family transposase [Elusimicrobiota bacterium]